MRCRLRAAEPFTGEKVTLCLKDAPLALHLIRRLRRHLPLKGKAHCRILISDRDFVTASPPITSFSFSEKEKEGKRKTAQGVPPLGELHYFAAGRSGEIMNSRRLHPPRPPGERVRPVAAATEMLCTAEKVSVFGAKVVCSASRAARFRLCLPLRGEGARRADEV